MKTSREIREELADLRVNRDNFTDGSDQIITGWIEALEWVLSDFVEEGK